MKINFFIILLLILGLFFLNGCQKNTERGVIVNIQEETDNIEIKENNQIKEFNLVARQFEFEPNTITVNKGDKVKLTITSADVGHGFALPDFNINKKLNPGENVFVEFTADKSGEFSFFCNVFCGSGHGSMKGKLIVK